ncbi:hypothetical protein EN868_11150 [Mesorhizobium sp. M2D.F.Ca.ET.225.01.1.1]|uniref:hypothetical protein n=1 Tax=unclassified Mesorhizobium TaxID=325217 RepID=UPI000FD205FB|nr:MULTISPECIES: hypothetical protein [unclassified Mesorhizobium]TGP59541.1 hypothetical protein EN869_014820 [Mesorhizobium sp. M2D.F.Ca.ET.226.01.1.1]TGP69176.1 hypothetical protein EN868_11150 [Mesorhizobium sp. M2D.F.Ca.ET.225.01.1.1]
MADTKNYTFYRTKAGHRLAVETGKLPDQFNTDELVKLREMNENDTPKATRDAVAAKGFELTKPDKPTFTYTEGTPPPVKR